MRKDIFREVALERLSSPEQLDQLMQVTTRKGWLALGALGGVLVAALVWGVFGSVPDRIGGQGILVRSGGIYEVVSESDGRVTGFSVQVGDLIREGEVVARLAQPEVAEQVRQVRERVAQLEAQHRHVAEFGARDTELQAVHLAQSRANLEQSIRTGEATLRALAEKVGNEEQLASQGLITRHALLTTVQEYERAREKVRADRGELTQLRVRELQARNSNEKALEESRFRLSEARRELARLESEGRHTSEVVSPYTGRVLEVMTERGSFVGRGKPVLTVDLAGRSSSGLEAVVYVPSVHGKKVKPGMEIQIVPSTVQKEEYGYLLGRVTYVSDFPSTPNGMQRVLKNEQLASALSGTDAPYEVHAELFPAAGNASLYRWSSSGGPPIRIQSGTLARADIVVQRRRPISVLIPQLRKHTAPVGERTAGRVPAAGSAPSRDRS